MSTKLAYVVFFATIATAFNITTLRTSTPLRPTPECNTTINFIVHDMDTYNSSVSPERTAQTSCSAAWPALNGTPPTKWQSCVDTNFSWMFSDGESDIQGFKNVGDFGFSVSHGWEEPGYVSLALSNVRSADGVKTANNARKTDKGIWKSLGGPSRIARV
ncbi:MAG: hypothetical protein M1828_001243 [Chrysothrix sp. TS-e1954]|nr:MAG: hypothetical protein M1828_001243 [Chrysothrix sp. TS-e1954]